MKIGTIFEADSLSSFTKLSTQTPSWSWEYFEGICIHKSLITSMMKKKMCTRNFEPSNNELLRICERFITPNQQQVIMLEMTWKVSTLNYQIRILIPLKTRCRPSTQIMSIADAYEIR